MVLDKCYSLALDDSERSNGKSGEESGMRPFFLFLGSCPVGGSLFSRETFFEARKC